MTIPNWFERRFVNTELGNLIMFILAIVVMIGFLGRILFPFLVSIAIAYLLDDPVKRLERYNIPHFLAVNIIFLAFFGLSILALFILLPLISDQLLHLTNYIPQKITAYFSQFSQQYPHYISTERVHQLIANFQTDFTRIGKLTLSFSVATITNILTLLLYLVLAPFFVYFLLKDKSLFLNWGAKFLPKKHHLIAYVWQEIDKQLGNYIRGKALEIIIVATVASIVFSLLRLNYAILFGAYMGLVSLLPYIGVVMVLVPLMIVSYLQWGLTIDLLYVLIAYVVIDGVDGNILAPLLFSETMKIHPLAVIIAVIMFGGLWGFWGLFFALPLAAVVKVLLNLKLTVMRGY